MRYFSNLGLSHSTKRRKGAQELRLPQAEQKVRLILSWIDSLAKHGESRCGAVAAFPFTRRGRRVYVLDDRIVAGRDVITAKRCGFTPKVSKLQLLIAHHARIWSPAGLVFA